MNQNDDDFAQFENNFVFSKLVAPVLSAEDYRKPRVFLLPRKNNVFGS